MDDKRLNEKESIELIANMISNTKRRIETADGNLLLNWGILTIVTTAIVWATVWLTKSAAGNWLWALMAIGAFFNRKEAVRQRKRGYISYTDKVCSTIWTVVGILGLFCLVMCIAFHLFTGVSPWFIMFSYALIVVGFGVICSGAMLMIRSMVLGGVFSVAYGLVLACCVLTDTPITAEWLIPLFMLCFLFMMVIPGLEMRKKAKENHERA